MRFSGRETTFFVEVVVEKDEPMNKLPNADTLKKLHDKGLSIRDIAKIYNVSRQAVSDAFKRNDIQITPHPMSYNEYARSIEKTIVRYRKVGYSYARIAKITNVPESTVGRICDRNNVQRGKRKTRLTEQEIVRLREYRKSGMSHKDIGNLMDYDTMTIWRACKEFEIE